MKKSKRTPATPQVLPFFSLRSKRLMHDIAMELYSHWAVNFHALPTTSLHMLPQV